MADAKVELVKNWLTKAYHDLETAKVLSKVKEPLLDTAIYHCQQAAEKAIKGFLVFHDIEFEKTHDVSGLIELSIKTEPTNLLPTKKSLQRP